MVGPGVQVATTTLGATRGELVRRARQLRRPRRAGPVAGTAARGGDGQRVRLRAVLLCQDDRCGSGGGHLGRRQPLRRNHRMGPGRGAGGARNLPVSAHCAPALHLAPASVGANLRHIEYVHGHTRVDRLLFRGPRAKRRCTPAIRSSWNGSVPQPSRPALHRRVMEMMARHCFEPPWRPAGSDEPDEEGQDGGGAGRR